MQPLHLHPVAREITWKHSPTMRVNERRLLRTDGMVPQKILLIDDQRESSRALGLELSRHGYDVKMIDADAEGLDSITDWTPDLVFINSPMSVIRAVEMCGDLRSKLQSAFIIVLAPSGEAETSIQALESGADSSITQSYSVNELMARVRSGLRRVGKSIHEDEIRDQASTIDVGHFHINLLSRRTAIQGREVRLTPKEFDLLCYLARNPRIVIPRETLHAVLWGSTNNPQTEYLHVLMNRLRKKVEPEGSSTRYILTEKWVGYRFEPGGVIFT